MVSIIVPVYNCAESLERCVPAILAQTERDFELILVDDGSKDSSGSICDRFAAADPRIRVIHKPNGGVSSARNAGLDAAEGSYVMFCDSDDYPEPCWCELLLAAAEKAPDAFPVCNYLRETPSGSSVNYEKECESLSDRVEPGDFFRLYRLELLGTPWNKLFRRELLEAEHLRFPSDLSLGEDLIFNLHYMRRMTGGFTVVKQPLYHYVLGNSESLSARYYQDLAGIYERIFSELRNSLQTVPDGFGKYAEEFWTSCFFAFDRVFRNTESDKNPMSSREKQRFNAEIFHGKLFQQCRSGIPEGLIHPLQAAALRTNSYRIYWETVKFTEWLSRVRHSR